MGQEIFDFGDDPRAANVVKLAGNFLLISAIEAMAEAFTFGEKNGIDRPAMAELFGRTLFACPIYQNYGKMVAAQKPTPGGFRLALALKDVNLALAAAGASAVPMPLASLLRDRLLSSQARGGGDLDVSRLALEVSESAGLKPGS
jgi:3-hydroxyisobutyrate dehydrogenase-like beta-hydroxyacid dehydrogenase